MFEKYKCFYATVVHMINYNLRLSIDKVTYIVIHFKSQGSKYIMNGISRR